MTGLGRVQIRGWGGGGGRREEEEQEGEGTEGW